MGGGVAFFGLAMAAMGCVIAYFTCKYSREKLLIEARSKDGANFAAADSAAEIERLKERVGVLERLVTSEETRVSREIDRLKREDLSPRA